MEFISKGLASNAQRVWKEEEEEEAKAWRIDPYLASFYMKTNRE